MRLQRHLADLAQDIQDHIEQETRDNIARGMTPDEARYAALRKFGNVGRIQEDTRGVWIWRPLEQFAQDLRHGLRTLRRNPVFALVAIVTLALGIGMNTAVFSVVNAVLIQPLPYPNPERLVWMSNVDERGHFEAVAGPDFLDWREQAQSFEKIACYGYMDSTLKFGGDADRQRIVTASSEFWGISGAKPALGRLFAAGERDEMVLSDSLFERRFGRDPKVVGKVVSLDDRPVTVIGILPKAFHFLSPVIYPGLQPKEVDAYVPSTVSPANQVRGRSMAIVYVVAKLKPNVGIDAARSEMNGIQARIALQNPEGMYDMLQLQVLPLREKLDAKGRRALLVLLAAVALVLLIACVNMANLLLARATARQKEIAIRAAVGAGRGRLLGQFLTESLLLTFFGGAVGLGLARWAIALMIRLSPQAVPRLGETHIDAPVLAFTLGLSLATGILFGLSPAIAFSKNRLEEVLKEGGRTSSTASAGGHVRALLAAAEMALTMVLLLGAGLMLKSFWRMNAHPPGFDPERVLVMKVALSGANYTAVPAQLEYMNRVLLRAASAPGVEAAGIYNLPARLLVGVEGQAPLPLEQIPQASYHSVSAGYIRALGMAVVEGRWVSDDEPNTVVVVNEAFTHRVFGNGDPIGRRINIPGQQPSPTMATIVGVVRDLKYSKLDAEPEPEIYAPYKQSRFLREMDVVVRTVGDPAAVAPAVRKLISAIDSSQPVYDMKILEQSLAESIAPRRFNMFLLGTFAATALLMALVGIYGVIAYSVAQRTHEIGVRMALGAQRGEVMRMVVRQALWMVLAGIAAGLIAALGLTRLMESLLYDVQPTDAPTFAVVAGALMITALLAIWTPAFRASHVDPMTALRYE